MTGPADVALDVDQLTTRFVGLRRRLARIAFSTGLLTVLTLGLYRFWARTRLRRWYWSSIRPGGLPLEYTGNGFEKFAGFLIAVVILAFWLAVVNLLAMFASLSYLGAPGYAYGVSLAILVPVWFWARYRARAYMLSRTRWRGIRFGMEPRAGGYAVRACVHWLLTLLSLGLLWPRMTYKLEAFRTERSFYGSQSAAQGGSWTMLWSSFAPAYLTAIAMGVVAWLMVEQGPDMVWAYVPLVPMFVLFVLYYRVRSLRQLTETKSIGPLDLTATMSPRVVLRIVFFNGLAIMLLLAVPLLVLATLEVYFLPAGTLTEPDRLLELGWVGWAILGGLAVIYFVLFLIWGVMRHVLITMPILAHYARSIEISGALELATVAQVNAADAGSADGFAEALDIGAGI